MYANYISESSNIQKENQIKRATFFRLASTLTHADSKLRRAVDYVGGFLINDNFATIQRLADAFFPAIQDKVEFNAELEVARRYLKYGFNALVEPNGCIAHRISFGLLANDKEETREVADCVGCKHIFFLLDHLKNALLCSPSNYIEFQQSAARALEGSYMKILLFLGHRLRVMNQQNAIKIMFKEMDQRCTQKNGRVRDCD